MLKLWFSLIFFFLLRSTCLSQLWKRHCDWSLWRWIGPNFLKRNSPDNSFIKHNVFPDEGYMGNDQEPWSEVQNSPNDLWNPRCKNHWSFSSMSITLFFLLTKPNFMQEKLALIKFVLLSTNQGHPIPFTFDWIWVWESGHKQCPGRPMWHLQKGVSYCYKRD